METNIWGEDILDSKDYYDEGSVLYRNDLFDSTDEIHTALNVNSKNVFYTLGGEFLGYDNKNENNVYVTTKENYQYSLKNTEKPDYDGLRKHSTDLRISYTNFERKCSAVYGESSIGYGIFVEEELYAIASVHIRNSVAYGVNSALAKKFRNTPLLKRNSNREMKVAIAAFLNALLDGYDHSHGAKQWDGAEQAMIPATDLQKPSNGRFMYKVNVMGWDIKDQHYYSWRTTIENKFGAGKFTAPQKQEALFNYGGMKNKGKIRLFSVQQLALTIFWKEI